MTLGSFTYMDPATYTISSDPPSPWTKVDCTGVSYGFCDKKKVVENLRGQEANFGIDISGFGIYHYPVKEKAFDNDAEIKSNYYKEVEQLLRDKLPAIKKVVFFNHTIRRNQKGWACPPIQQVHVDQTPESAEPLVREFLPSEEVEELLKGRWQIINIWRPIGHPAVDLPLAVLDWRSTKSEDFVKIYQYWPIEEKGENGKPVNGHAKPAGDPNKSTEGYEIKGSTYCIAPSENHRFFYMKDMTPDEVLLIKCFDSRSECIEGGVAGIAGMTPHAAFADPEAPADAPKRHSIEARCLVFFE